MSDPVTNPSPSGSDEKQTEQPGSATGNQGGSGSGSEGRTPDQVYGEMKRRHDKLEGTIRELSAGIKALTDRFGAPQQPQNPGTYQPQQPMQPASVVSPYGVPRALGQYSDDQLQTALTSPTIPDSQKRIITQEILDRNEERRFNQRFEMRERQAKVNTLKKQSEDAAYSRFPALRNPDSEFSRRVTAELNEQRQTLGEFPTDTFDVASRVADSMGLEVKRSIVPGFTAPATGERPAEQKQMVNIPSDAELEKLAKKFAHTLPSDVDKDGRVVRRKFDMKRVKERSKSYGEAEGIARTRGMKVEG